MAVMERGERALHHRRGLAGAADHADPQPPGDHPGQLGELHTGGLDPGEDGAGARQQQLARRSEAHRPARPLEERDAVLAFQALAASQAAVQLTRTADVVGLVVGQLVLGPLSDARGRRRLLIGSTLVCALASVLCALAPTAGWLAVWRFLQDASGGGGIVLARAVAADIASGSRPLGCSRCS
jgi:hypothetical protein